MQQKSSENLQGKTVLNLNNPEGITIANTKEHFSLLASVLLSYEGLVAGWMETTF
ncbi:hypothetical protein Hanom_Chr07g00628031 [Helianthus anomalus]